MQSIDVINSAAKADITVYKLSVSRSRYTM